MKHDVKVVIGANYGDEGKGLVSCCLAKEALDKANKTLIVLYNGGAQRGHTANGVVHHCTGAGTELGCDTYYAPRFMLDPIALWLSESKVYIDPLCRVVLPCDVANNRGKESARGSARHGSCGMGIFEASKRNGNPDDRLLARELFNDPVEFVRSRIRMISDKYGHSGDTVYNMHNFYDAVRWMRKNCICASLVDIQDEYQTVIFEGGQGLLLDQANQGGFPHLTPSSTGSRNVLGQVKQLRGIPDVYYVSRTYMTRHGAGKMLNECPKEAINPDIFDETNLPNEWQGELRFGFLSPDQQIRRIKRDFRNFYGFKTKRLNLVYTQANFTDGKLAIGKGALMDILKPEGVDRVFVSDRKDGMERWLGR